MKQLRTKDNVHFEEPLSELISFRVTEKEMNEIDVVSRENYISISELIRNLIRSNLSDYAISPELKKNLKISHQIDAILLKKRIISSRNQSNLSKIREILFDFEAFLSVCDKKCDESEVKNNLSEVEGLIQEVYEVNRFLFSQIESQYCSIMKNKVLKRLNQ